ncbi:MAG: peptidyl-prolyl cis-trans isomerase [Verrucomicrobia bacterium]|nr:peptidyl-prolyl cis-trans isomerase [Verrucomicrobiota bacterium]
MLDLIRKRQRTLLTLITVVVIVAFAWFYNPTTFRRGMMGTGQLGKVNGRTVTVEDVQKLERDLSLALQLGLYDLPSQLSTDGRTRDEQVVSYVWNLFILRDAAARLELNPTPDQIKDAEKSLAVFQTDGHFDGSKYEKFVESIKGGGLHALDIDSVVADNLRLKNLDSLLRPVAQLPEAMFKHEYELADLKMHVAVISFKRADFEKDVQVTDAEIKKYYDEQKDHLQSPEKRKVALVSFALKDDQKNLSGDKRNEALKPLAEQAEAFTQPVLDKPDDFQKVAQQKGLLVQETGLFTASQPDPLISAEPAITRQAFSLTRENPISDIIQGVNGFYVIKLLQLQPSQPLTLEQAKDQIVTALKQEKTTAVIEAKAKEAQQKIAAGMKGGLDFLQAAEKAGYKPETPAPFTLSDAGADNPVALTLVRNRVELQPNETSKLLQSTDGAMLVHLISRDPLVPAKYEEEKKKEYPLANERFSSAIIREWLRVEQQKAGRPPI